MILHKKILLHKAVKYVLINQYLRNSKNRRWRSLEDCAKRGFSVG